MSYAPSASSAREEMIKVRVKLRYKGDTRGMVRFFLSFLTRPHRLSDPIADSTSRVSPTTLPWTTSPSAFASSSTALRSYR
jgi:hypothetical protein